MKTQAIDISLKSTGPTRQSSSARRPTQALDSSAADGSLTLSITCGHCLQTFQARGDENGPFESNHECRHCILDHCKTHERGEHGKADQ